MLAALFDLIVAGACIAMLAAVLVLAHRRPPAPAERRAIRLITAFLAFLSLYFLTSLPNLEAVALRLHAFIDPLLALLAVVIAALLWRHLPRLAEIPTLGEIRHLGDRLDSELPATGPSSETEEDGEEQLHRTLYERTRELVSMTARFQLILRGSGVTVFQQDSDLNYSWIYNVPDGRGESAFLGRSDEDVLPPEAARSIAPAKRRVLAGGGPESLDVRLPGADGEEGWYKMVLEPVIEEGRIAGIAGVAIDISEERRSREQLVLLLRELTHRSKNLMAVIQAIARQSARHVDSTEEFLDRFGARLAALSRAHDVLVSEDWQSAEMGEIVRQQIDFIDEALRQRISIGGPPVRLTPDMAQSLALAVHELATNAHKHGALAREEGRVVIDWSIASGQPDPAITFRWRERGVAADDGGRSGFGRVMLERLLPQSLDGDAAFRLSADGLDYEIRFPLPPVGRR